MDWPATSPLASARLLMEPLAVGHASEMAGVLAAPSIYEFTGGQPPTAEQLTRRYARQAEGGPADASQGWCNWIIRRRDTGQAIGFTQATLEMAGPSVVADVAWVVAPAHQGHGFATEAAGAMCEWLRQHGVARLLAYVGPENLASAAVARKLGMHATGAVVEGETCWEC